MKAMQPHMGNAGFDPDLTMCEDTPNEENNQEENPTENPEEKENETLD